MTHEIKSPLPGSFFRRPAPDEPPFKEVGDFVATGETIGLIEVMKTFQEVKADADGRIASFDAQDSEPVAAGQVLATLL